MKQNLRRNIIAVVTLFALLVGLCAPSDASAKAAAGVKLKATSKTVEVGDTVLVKAVRTGKAKITSVAVSLVNRQEASQVIKLEQAFWTKKKITVRVKGLSAGSAEIKIKAAYAVNGKTKTKTLRAAVSVSGQMAETDAAEAMVETSETPAETPLVETDTTPAPEIVIGESTDTLKSDYGTPTRKDDSPSGLKYWIYNESDTYENYMIVGVDSGSVVMLYTTDKDFSYQGITCGMTAETLGDSGFSNVEKGQYKYKTDDCTIYAYCDYYGDQQVYAVQVIQKGYVAQIENALSCTYSAAVLEDYATQIFELTNAFRVRLGYVSLAWDGELAVAAKLHSQDMADNNYFSHTGLDGSSYLDRIRAQKGSDFSYFYAGENIGCGYPDSIAAVTGWIYSEGHRSNLLGQYQYLGVGVGYNEKSDYLIYAAQEFYL